MSLVCSSFPSPLPRLPSSHQETEDSLRCHLTLLQNQPDEALWKQVTGRCSRVISARAEQVCGQLSPQTSQDSLLTLFCPACPSAALTQFHPTVGDTQHHFLCTVLSGSLALVSNDFISCFDLFFSHFSSLSLYFKTTFVLCPSLPFVHHTSPPAHSSPLLQQLLGFIFCSSHSGMKVPFPSPLL